MLSKEALLPTRKNILGLWPSIISTLNPVYLASVWFCTSLALLCGLIYLDWKLIQMADKDPPIDSASYKLGVYAVTLPKSHPAEDSASLFGNIEIADTSTSIVEAPLTELDLTLKATFTYRDENRSYAVIEQNGKAEGYHSGMDIGEGVRLIAIYSGYAIIRRNGRDEKIILDILKNGDLEASTYENDSNEIAPEKRPLKDEKPARATTAVTLSERLNILRESREK